MSFPIYIASRYLLSKKSHHAINIISGVSVCGVAIATAALVCILSVFNGFQDMVADLFTSFDPELKVVPARGKYVPADFGGLDVKGQERKIKPALVAAALGAPDLQHADKQHAENQQQLSPLGDDIDVNERQKDVNNDAENERERLCADIPGVSDIICGAGDDHDAEDRRCDAQREKNHIRFSDKLPDGPEYFTQSRHLPAKSYKIVTSHYSKFCAVCKPKV